MVNVVKLRKGLDINLKGKPEEKMLEADVPQVYALRPDDFTGVVPKVCV